MNVSINAKSKEGHQFETTIDVESSEDELKEEEVINAFNKYLKDVNGEDWTIYQYKIISFKKL